MPDVPTSSPPAWIEEIVKECVDYVFVNDQEGMESNDDHNNYDNDNLSNPMLKDDTENIINLCPGIEMDGLDDENFTDDFIENTPGKYYYEEKNQIPNNDTNMETLQNIMNGRVNIFNMNYVEEDCYKILERNTMFMETSNGRQSDECYQNDNSTDSYETDVDTDTDSMNDGLYNEDGDKGIELFTFNSDILIDMNNINDVKRQISSWLENLSRKVEFIYIHSLGDFSDQELEQNIDKDKICDPYVSVEDENLRNSILNVFETNTGEPVDKIQGKCTVVLTNGDELVGNWRRGKREGHGEIFSKRLEEKMKIKRICGTYVDGLLSGKGNVYLTDESMNEGWFCRGYLHGPVKGTIVGLGDTIHGQRASLFPQVTWVGWYRAGLPLGTCWTSLEGRGWLVGRPDCQGAMSGDRILYLYPDLATALVGRFSAGQLVSAVPGKVVDVSLVNGVMVPKVRITAESVYKSWVSTNKAVMCPPHQRDVYETETVTVDQSTMPHSGEGLFAKINLPADNLVAFYNGIRLKPGEPDLWGDTGYAIYIDWNKERGKITSDHMDIPPELQSSSNYTATLGHKVNHSFHPNCSWTNVFHPCYGRIPAIKTLVNVQAGEELFIHYLIDMAEAPQWYKDVWEDFSIGEKQDD